ncbi:MAG: TIGR00730 family Rossman fold protein, partial [Anaerolineae bacterium]
GGLGTFEELFEALTWAQIGVHRKPIGLLNVRRYFDPLLSALDHAVEEGFIFREHRESIHCAEEPTELLRAMRSHHHPDEAVRRWMRQA